MDQLKDALEILQTCLDRRFSELKLRKQLFEEDTLALTVAEMLLYLRYDARFYVICTNEQIVELWETIRAEPAFTDFLLALKAEYLARIGRVEAMRVAEQLSEGLSISNMNAELLDEDTYERLPTSTWIERTLKENDWFLTLTLLNLLPVTHMIRFTSELSALSQSITSP
jgi:hypothetical protein